MATITKRRGRKPIISGNLAIGHTNANGNRMFSVHIMSENCDDNARLHTVHLSESEARQIFVYLKEKMDL